MYKSIVTKVCTYIRMRSGVVDKVQTERENEKQWTKLYNLKSISIRLAIRRAHTHTHKYMENTDAHLPTSDNLHQQGIEWRQKDGKRDKVDQRFAYPSYCSPFAFRLSCRRCSFYASDSNAKAWPFARVKRQRESARVPIQPAKRPNAKTFASTAIKIQASARIRERHGNRE